MDFSSDDDISNSSLSTENYFVPNANALEGGQIEFSGGKKKRSGKRKSKKSKNSKNKRKVKRRRVKRSKKRPLNAFMKAKEAARKAGKNSFTYTNKAGQRKRYVRKMHAIRTGAKPVALYKLASRSRSRSRSSRSSRSRSRSSRSRSRSGSR